MNFDVEQLKADVGNHLQARHLGWCNQPYPLYAFGDKVGPMVVHLTIERHLWLLWNENAFFCGADEDTNFEASIRQFLYLVSPDCVPFDAKAREKWNNAHTDLDFDLCKIGIAAYMQAQFCNGTGYVYRQKAEPKQSGESAHPDLFKQVQAILDPLKYGHFAAHYFRLFHREFGWSKEQIFSTPYPQLHMLEWEIIFERSGKDGPSPYRTYFNAYLESLNA